MEVTPRHKLELRFIKFESDITVAPSFTFRLSRFGESEPILEQTALLRTGDTHFEGLEISVPIILGDQIVVYRYWNYWGMDFGTPVGVQRTVYRLNDSGLEQVASQIYYEPGFQMGGRIIRQHPLDGQERAERVALIAGIAAEFDAEFLDGELNKALITDVQLQLSEIVSLYTRHWCSNPSIPGRTVAGHEIGLTPCEN